MSDTNGLTDAEVIRLIEESGALLAAYEPRVWLVNLKDVRALLAEQAQEPKAEDAPSDAARDVLAERQRQISTEGWTPEHDDEHNGHEMAHAAACYAYPELTALVGVKTWPWAAEWFKVRDHRSNYVRAAALLLAEIERLDRAAIAAQPAVQQPAEDAGLLDRHGKIRGDLKASAYCVGNEFKPFHPRASHVRPEWRDGWNACFVAAIKAQGGKQ